MDKEFDPDYLALLAYKFKEGTLTPQEKADFDNWYNQHQDERAVFPEGYGTDADTVRERMLSGIQQRTGQLTSATSTTHRISAIWLKIAAAASVLLIVGIAMYLFLQRQPAPSAEGRAVSAASITAGSDKAMLTLSNGKIIELNEDLQGPIVSERNVSITKTKGGELIYATSNVNVKSNAANIIATPKGAKFQVRLPDGTKVWLNAASSLQYPVSFLGQKERRVRLSGEAYFQVAKDKEHPFFVQSEDQEVKVLGTHFNINSYKDEGKTVTTLEEGAVMVRSGKQEQAIRPGEQTSVLSAGQLTKGKADFETAMAWRNNEMVFKEASIQQVMRQVSRWYDLEIEYRGKLPEASINGTIDRNDNLESVLRMFAAIQVKFKLERTATGNKLILQP